MKAFYSLLLLAAVSAQAQTPYDPSADKSPITIKPNTSTVSGPNTPSMPSSATPNQPPMPSSNTPNQPPMPSSNTPNQPPMPSSKSSQSTSSSKASDAFQIKAAGSIAAFTFVLSYFM
jgi:hypothetical protein